MTDCRPDPDEEPSATDGEPYHLATPGPYGDVWTLARLETTGVTLSGDGREATVRYADRHEVDSVSVQEVHGDERIVADLVALGVTLVLAGGAALARRLTGLDADTPARLDRYANEIVATSPLVRLRLVTDDGSYYLYADEATVSELSDALRTRAGLDA